MNSDCPLKIGLLYKTKQQTMLFRTNFLVENIPENKILLLIETKFNKAENMWCLAFIYENKVLKACNHMVCDRLQDFFEEVITEET